MHIPYLETHRQNAQALYRQRLSWLQLPAVAMPAMLDLERRLRAHVFVLSRCVEPDAVESEAPESDVPGQPADLFVHLAARLSALESPLRREAAQRACELLAAPGPRAEAAWYALMLFPHEDARDAIAATFEAVPETRGLLLEICDAHDMDLPRRWLEAPELADQPRALQAALLTHGARRYAVGPEVYQRFCEVPADDTDPIRALVLYGGLWGALVRADREAIRAVHSALVRYNQGEIRARLLRLLALSGASSAPALLRDYLDEAPDVALPLLALHGGRAAVEVILDALDDPRCAEFAARAWAQVTGQPLSSRPRLALVGSGASVNGVGEMPESAPARAWWKLNAPRLREGDRWYEGEPLTPALLIQRMSTRTGYGSADQADLLSLLLRRPVAMALAGCHGVRCSLLQGFDQASGRGQHHA